MDKAVLAAPPRALGKALRLVPRALIDWKKNAAFREVVRYAYKRSSFYKRKFDEKGIDPSKVSCPADLGDFYTAPPDIIDHAEEFLCRKPHMVFE